MKIDIIRSSRKTISMTVRNDLSVEVRAPRRMSDREIREFIEEHRGWLEKHLETAEKKEQEARESGPLTEEEIRELTEQARADFPERVRRHAEAMGVTYGKITIRHQKTRWGSCSAEGNLNFNCLLMLMPEEIRDYVVIHELAHRKEMNHSPAFWKIVEAQMPDYQEKRRWLKEEGGTYIRRMEERPQTSPESGS